MELFAKIKISSFYSSEPYLGAGVWLEGPDEDQFYHAEILKVDFCDDQVSHASKPLEFGNYINFHARDLQSMITIMPEDPEGQELASLREKFLSLHRNAPYVIRGCIYSEEPRYSQNDMKHRNPRYERTAYGEWKPGPEVKSLEDCEKWILKNHPDYYEGYSAMQDCPSGNFRFLPEPGCEYPAGRFETIENRRKYAAERAEELGIPIGPFELDEMQEERE